MTMRSISFCHWKKTCIFLKEKTWKRIYDTNSELSQNKTEKQIRSYKAIRNWLFNDISYYLFIACFDWKINVFQQLVIRVYYILKCCCVIFLMVDPRPIYSAMENKMIRGFSYWGFHIVLYVPCLCVGKGRHINITFWNCLDIFYEIFIYIFKY